MYSFKQIRWIVLSLLMLLLVACNGTPGATPEPPIEPSEEQEQQEQKSEPEPEPEPEPEQPVEVEEGMPPTVLEAGTTVIRALKNGDLNTLAAWADPNEGVRFSPYGNVNTETDLIFSRDELEGLMKDSTKHLWRSFPGSDTLIEMPYSEYHGKFVYDVDFMEDAEITVNEGLGQGAMIYNLNEVYPEDTHDFVDYYMDGIDPAVEGMDWRSLRLVFKKIGDDRSLVGIIHDQWTP
ncbi:hypothetical protein [Sporosarcina sp. FSL K6-2383]|uniref:hypothetical protein n=1 Tax=Sporosarcina sp. FSL K6-2383 TaxID=2921556 RepID=UPI00315A746F